MNANDVLKRVYNDLLDVTNTIEDYLRSQVEASDNAAPEGMQQQGMQQQGTLQGGKKPRKASAKAAPKAAAKVAPKKKK